MKATRQNKIEGWRPTLEEKLIMNTSIMLALLNGTGTTKEELESALFNSERLITKEIEELHIKRNMIRDIINELDKGIKEEQEEFFADLFEDE